MLPNDKSQRLLMPFKEKKNPQQFFANSEYTNTIKELPVGWHVLWKWRGGCTCCLLFGVWGSMVHTWNMSS